MNDPYNKGVIKVSKPYLDYLEADQLIIKELKQVLKFYANEENYKSDGKHSSVTYDNGLRARIVLDE